MKEVSEISELLNAAKSLFEKANTPERERIGRVLFSELRVFGNTLQYRVTIGVKPFEARLTSIKRAIRVAFRTSHPYVCNSVGTGAPARHHPIVT